MNILIISFRSLFKDEDNLHLVRAVFKFRFKGEIEDIFFCSVSLGNSDSLKFVWIKLFNQRDNLIAGKEAPLFSLRVCKEYRAVNFYFSN